MSFINNNNLFVGSTLKSNSIEFISTLVMNSTNNDIKKYIDSLIYKGDNFNIIKLNIKELLELLAQISNIYNDKYTYIHKLLIDNIIELINET